MKTTKQIIRSQDGFTLLELILVLTLASVVFAMMFTYFSRSMLDSTAPVTRLAQSLDLTGTAERITAYYKQTTNLDRLQESLELTPEQFGSDFSVKENYFIKFVNNNDTAIAEGETEDTLKITLEQDQTHERLTMVFTQQ